MRNLEKMEIYLKAGKIASTVLKEIRSKVRPGVNFSQICEQIENRIRELGGEPAFPTNICVNEIAAHDTAEIEDIREVHDGDVVKIDIGVHVDGYIADTAITVNFSEYYATMTTANMEVLNLALKKIKPGESIGEVGNIVYSSALSMGYKVVTNLSGHELGQYQIHAGQSVPNTPVNGFIGRFGVGRCYAIEPFLTSNNAAAYVEETDKAAIYSIVKRKRLKDQVADRFLEKVWERRKTLPFSARWFKDLYDKNELLRALDYLAKNKVIRAYPVLKEATDQVVCQFEHTVFITEKNTIITTI